MRTMMIVEMHLSSWDKIKSTAKSSYQRYMKFIRWDKIDISAVEHHIISHISSHFICSLDSMIHDEKQPIAAKNALKRLTPRL